MSVLFTADTHFNHRNIIEYCNRPFRTADGHLDVHLMNATLINNWNARVQPEDTIYHIGDVAMGTKAQMRGLRARLNGRIILVRGNHDNVQHCRGFADAIHTNLHVTVDGVRLYLQHIPAGLDYRPPSKYKPELVVVPDPASYDYWICGHVHHRWARMNRVINAGVDIRDYQPKTLEELLSAPYDPIAI